MQSVDISGADAVRRLCVSWRKLTNSSLISPNSKRFSSEDVIYVLSAAVCHASTFSFRIQPVYYHIPTLINNEESRWFVPVIWFVTYKLPINAITTLYTIWYNATINISSHLGLIRSPAET